jgi:IMP dehydrogenase
VRFVNDVRPPYELTYNDVFMVPSLSSVRSRLDVDLTTPDRVGTTLPIVVANMNAVSGKRMAETVARRGGVSILPQDAPLSVLAAQIAHVKASHSVYDTPVTLSPNHTIADALSLIHKRAHGAIVIVDDDGCPVGVFKEGDGVSVDRFTPLGAVMSDELITVDAHLSAEGMFDHLAQHRVSFAPVVQHGRLVGSITRLGALRSTLYQPALDAQGRLLVGVAVGINGDPVGRAEGLLEAGADLLVIDTAHGHQSRMIEVVEKVRAAAPSVTIVAGNVVTVQGTENLIDAGADIVKVGVGPGAMCTTRMMTGVGRPQFSAVLDCAAAAEAAGKHIWADGGVRHPRDVALALAAGAASVMVGSWFAGTYESAGDTMRDAEGKLYKENFGMASNRAVRDRTRNESLFERARKELFEEGISTSRMYIDPRRPGVEDLLDHIAAGVRSAFTYAGATTIPEFQRRATFGIQSSAGFDEGRPVGTSW